MGVGVDGLNVLGLMGSAFAGRLHGPVGTSSLRLTPWFASLICGAG